MEEFLHAPSRLPFERLGQRLPAQGLVLLKLVARHEEVGSHRVKAAGACVGGQLAHVDVGAEQFPQGIAVFTPVEPSHGDGAFLVAKGFPSHDHDVGEVVQKIGFLGVPGLFFVLGRHLARVEGVEHFLPALRGGQVLNAKW